MVDEQAVPKVSPFTFEEDYPVDPGQHVHRANHPTSMSNGLLSSEAMRHYDNCRGSHGAARGSRWGQEGNRPPVRCEVSRVHGSDGVEPKPSFGGNISIAVLSRYTRPWVA